MKEYIRFVIYPETENDSEKLLSVVESGSIAPHIWLQDQTSFEIVKNAEKKGNKRDYVYVIPGKRKLLASALTQAGLTFKKSETVKL